MLHVFNDNWLTKLPLGALSNVSWRKGSAVLKYQEAGFCLMAFVIPLATGRFWKLNWLCSYLCSFSTWRGSVKALMSWCALLLVW